MFGKANEKDFEDALKNENSDIQTTVLQDSSPGNMESPMDDRTHKTSDDQTSITRPLLDIAKIQKSVGKEPKKPTFETIKKIYLKTEIENRVSRYSNKNNKIDKNTKFCLVVDIDILNEELELLKFIATFKEIKGKPLYIIIPHSVRMELMNKPLTEQAKNACFYINHQMRTNGNIQIRGYNKTEHCVVEEDTKAEQIVNTCFREIANNNEVFILTHDTDLILLARLYDIMATQSIFSHL